jgi:hypothetical protein
MLSTTLSHDDSDFVSTQILPLSDLSATFISGSLEEGAEKNLPKSVVEAARLDLSMGDVSARPEDDTAKLFGGGPPLKCLYTVTGTGTAATKAKIVI